MGSDAGATDVPHPGDRRLRITVPMPRSLNELSSTAHRHFGRGASTVKMWHEGQRYVDQGEFDMIKHDDLVVVSPEAYERLKQEALLTTHQDHYVKHPIQAQRKKTPERRPQAHMPFDGTTSYHTDYVPHPVQPRSPVKPKQDPGPRQPYDVGESIYTSHYPRHPLQPRSSPKREHTREPGLPFDGTTSYQVDYVKHPVRPRSAPRKQERPTTPTPFEGSTTYHNDYKKHQVPVRPTSARTRDIGPPSPSLPFEGISEYKTEYLKHKTARRQWIHIEPEIRRSSRQSRQSSRGTRRR